MKKLLLVSIAGLYRWVVSSLLKGPLVLMAGLVYLATAPLASAQDVLWGLTSGLGPGGAGTAFSVRSDGTNATLHKAFVTAPIYSYGSLIKGSDGSFYGMTQKGGSSDQGTVFKVNADGSGFEIIHHFNYPTGAYPHGDLIEVSAGSFYGMTQQGGSNGGAGTLFKINADGSGFGVIHHFAGTDGANPRGSLTKGSDGSFYGMTEEGGNTSNGTAFKIKADGSGFVVLHHFTGAAGSSPRGGLVEGSDGSFYGLTYSGGSSNRGTVFKIKADGSNFGLIHTFTTANGAFPHGNLVEVSNGSFYGMTSSGGGSNKGTVFKIDADGSGFAIIHHFNVTNGEHPRGNLVRGTDGNYYGITEKGGSAGYGTLFRIDADGSGFGVLQHFTGATGTNPYGSPVAGSDGTFYGITSSGGGSGYGTVFKLKVDGSAFGVIHHFNSSTGTSPHSDLVKGSDGRFYGMTSAGGSSNWGTVFKIDADGSGFGIIHHFDGSNGAFPYGSLVQGTDGSFYGMTSSGGSGYGTVFKLKADGSGFQVIHQFTGSGGAGPYGSLVQGGDGSFYGVTRSGGSSSRGTAFKINADGSGFDIIHHFVYSNHGFNPRGNLVAGSDGSFYGVTSSGGNNGQGTLFKVGKNGFDVIHHFTGSGGASPYGSLVAGNDGSFYGTTSAGGGSDKGTVFKIKADGSDFKVIKHFTGLDGAVPTGSLVTGSDGSFYGTTFSGGSSDQGTVFRINADGSGFEVIKHFTGTNGANPRGSLVIQNESCTPPVASFNVSSVCVGTTTAFTDVSSGITAGAAYAWDVNNDGTADYFTKGNITHTYAAAGTYTAKLTIKQGTCEETFTQTVVVKALPTATLSGDASICPGGSTILNVTLTGTGPWEVTYTDGTEGATPVTVPTSASALGIAVSPGSDRKYTLTGVKDANCTGTVRGSATVAVNTAVPVPQVPALPDVTGACSVTITAAPKADSPCGGVLTATTTDPLEYTKQGTYTITWAYNNGSGMSATQTQQVIVKDATAPVPSVATLADASGDCSVTVTAPKANDNCAGSVTATTADPTTYAAQGSYVINWKYDDGNGNVTGQLQTVVVKDVTNPSITPPASLIVASDPGRCGRALTSIALGTPATGDNCGVASVTNNAPAEFPVGTTTVTWTVTDVNGRANTATQNVTVMDTQKPTISAITQNLFVLAPPNHRMRDVSLNYSVGDNCSGVTYSVTVTSNEPTNGAGDGDTDTDWEVVSNHLVRLRAERAAQGGGRIYTITVTATDGAGNTAIRTAQVVVAHNIVSPLSGQAVKVGSTVNFSGTFWDKPGNRHTASWSLDGITSVKGTVVEPSGLRNGTVTGTYKFTAPGVYKLHLNVRDQSGVTTSVSTAGDLEAIVVVYDPKGGYTVGGGWFTSPPGALSALPSASGKVSYGFQSNYYKGATFPKGETHFEFKVGELEFNALNFEYLSVAGGKAQFKGSGKIVGGQSGYSFILTVIDGAIAGGSDKIRMKIFNKNTGRVIYDNQPGASDAANPVTVVGTGSTIAISSGSVATARANAEGPVAQTEAAGGLTITAAPNPAFDVFTLTVASDQYREEIILQVYDVYGRVVEAGRLTDQSTLRLGTGYKHGIYYARVTQGRKQKEIKLIKLNN